MSILSLFCWHLYLILYCSTFKCLSIITAPTKKFVTFSTSACNRTCHEYFVVFSFKTDTLLKEMSHKKRFISVDRIHYFCRHKLALHKNIEQKQKQKRPFDAQFAYSDSLLHRHYSEYSIEVIQPMITEYYLKSNLITS